MPALLYLHNTNLRKHLELRSVSLEFQINNIVFKVCLLRGHSNVPK